MGHFQFSKGVSQGGEKSNVKKNSLQKKWLLRIELGLEKLK